MFEEGRDITKVFNGCGFANWIQSGYAATYDCPWFFRVYDRGIHDRGSKTPAGRVITECSLDGSIMSDSPGRWLGLDASFPPAKQTSEHRFIFKSCLVVIEVSFNSYLNFFFSSLVT